MFFATEKICQLLCGASSMTNAVLLLCSHLGESKTTCFDGRKDGIVAESFFTGSLLQLEGRGYANGICAHAPSSVTTTLDGKWRTLKFAYGLQDGGNGSVVFVVKGDGKELFRSALVKDHVRRDAEVDVDGVKTLELITEDGGDNNRSDHSIWIEPKLTR